MNLNMNYSFFFSLLFCIYFPLTQTLNAQNEVATPKDINTEISYANDLIRHYNKKIAELKNYQSDLNIWFQKTDRTKQSLPFLTHNDYKWSKKKAFKKNETKDIFDYRYNLSMIENHVFQFDKYYTQIQATPIADLSRSEQQKNIDYIYSIYRNIENEAKAFAEISYDFSRSCAVNYAGDNSNDLNDIKVVVSQAKNLILAIRDNNISLSKEYLELLDDAIQNIKTNFDLEKSYKASQSKLSLEDYTNLISTITQNAFQIAATGESYLQSTFQADEVSMLLQQAIVSFNQSENKQGCAAVINELISNSNSKLMLFLEEPNTLTAEKIEIKPIQQENISAIKKEVFDEKNLNTLEGSLPTNLIILLDVSVSMKKTNKLPILKQSIIHFTNIMRPDDKISLIAYSGEAKVLISGASSKDKKAISDTLSQVKSSGGADLHNALVAAYKIGEENFIKDGNNKIIIASDGLFGVNSSTASLVNEKLKKQFSLSVFHYSTINEDINLKTLKNLANTGQGSYRVIYNTEEAIGAMMKEIKKQDFSKR